MPKLFGTDGIRGVANCEPLTPERVLRLGQVVVERCRHRARVIVGRDTRRSGDLLEGALLAGICSAGGEALLAGVVPTPAVAYLVRHLEADIGIVVSASHNPYPDNGIKIFDQDGFKLPDDAEADIETRLMIPTDHRPSGSAVGTARILEDARENYVSHLLRSVGSHLDLEGIRIVIDCANGAASAVGPRLFERAGAKVESLFATPNGLNINQSCGATDPRTLQDAVRARGASLGVALDGDADRVILVDENGSSVDGDEILAILVDDCLRRGPLPANAVVATVMSNLGLELFLRELGVHLVRAAVGDRYVVEAMRSHGCILGGEQSGHVILMEHATTGDGLLAALSVAKIMRDRGCSLGALRGLMKRFPQALVNVAVRERHDLDSIDAVRQAVTAATTALGAEGRVLIRYSGTEPVVRIMVEGPETALVDGLAADIASAVRDSLGVELGS